MSASTNSGENGITAQAASAGTSTMSGASRNRNRDERAGTMISLSSSLITSAKGWARPRRIGSPKKETRFGPAPQLHVADHLALGERQHGDRRSTIEIEHAEDLQCDDGSPTAVPARALSTSRVDEGRHALSLRAARRACRCSAGARRTSASTP